MMSMGGKCEVKAALVSYLITITPKTDKIIREANAPKLVNRKKGES